MEKMRQWQERGFCTRQREQQLGGLGETEQGARQCSDRKDTEKNIEREEATDLKKKVKKCLSGFGT